MYVHIHKSVGAIAKHTLPFLSIDMGESGFSF